MENLRENQIEDTMSMPPPSVSSMQIAGSNGFGHNMEFMLRHTFIIGIRDGYTSSGFKFQPRYPTTCISEVFSPLNENIITMHQAESFTCLTNFFRYQKATDTVDYFSSLRFVTEIPMNPADFLLDLETG
ncbi:hypothetical protein TSUD_255500 [Trifolium subterraneum]|uniref:Uncharacterized protein n=1 Tax=Trifolium subterraneum TaxID=3900 RepID=A0A2Z6N0T2_TRISU|nr:hypothetical protein TSUD_255500 [Trifolium subterraneum]